MVLCCLSRHGLACADSPEYIDATEHGDRRQRGLYFHYKYPPSIILSCVDPAAHFCFVVRLSSVPALEASARYISALDRLVSLFFVNLAPSNRRPVFLFLLGSGGCSVGKIGVYYLGPRHKYDALGWQHRLVVCHGLYSDFPLSFTEQYVGGLAVPCMGTEPVGRSSVLFLYAVPCVQQER